MEINPNHIRDWYGYTHQGFVVETTKENTDEYRYDLGNEIDGKVTNGILLKDVNNDLFCTNTNGLHIHADIFIKSVKIDANKVGYVATFDTTNKG